VAIAGADAIGVVEVTEDESASDVSDALDKTEDAKLAELDVLKLRTNDGDGNEDAGDNGDEDEDADKDEACVTVSTVVSVGATGATAEYSFAVLEAIDGGLLVAASDLREAELEISAVDDVLSEAVTVTFAVTFEVT
jgi:hypothetical protein